METVKGLTASRRFYSPSHLGTGKGGRSSVIEVGQGPEGVVGGGLFGPSKSKRPTCPIGDDWTGSLFNDNPVQSLVLSFNYY